MSIGTVNPLRPQPPLTPSSQILTPAATAAVSRLAGRSPRHYPPPYPTYHPSTELPMEDSSAQRSRASFRLTAGPQTARDH